MGGAVNRSGQAGIGLIEVLIAALFLTISLLAVAMTMGQGISAMFVVQEQLIAKQKAREALESVFTARSTQDVTFDQINNAASGGLFLAGYQTLKGMGTDGMANTADDTTVETITFPGPDGNLGNADDYSRSLTNFQRQITVSSVLLQNGSVDPDIRQITADVRFQVNGRWWTVSVNSFISRFA